MLDLNAPLPEADAEQRRHATRLYMETMAASRFAETVLPGTTEPFFPQIVLALNAPEVQASLRRTGKEQLADMARRMLVGLHALEQEGQEQGAEDQEQEEQEEKQEEQ